MKRLFIFFFSIFLLQGYAQDLEMDAELIEINFQFSSNPTDFFHFKDQLFFRGSYVGLDDYTVFKYDGEIITMIKNDEGKRVISDKPIIGENLLYFYGSTRPYVDSYNLWVSDGTENSATPILETDWLPQDRFIIGDRLYFTIYGSTTKELWTSDGTFEGTFKLKDLYWNPNSSYSFDYLTECQGKLFFLTDDPTYGEELWISDGTVNGTYLVKDIREGAQSSNITSIFSFNEKIYFVANDGVNGNELWTSDGTDVGTYLVKDINSGTNNSLSQFDNQFIEFDGNFYFFANNGVNVQLWKSDGTTDGTVFYKNVNTFQYNYPNQTASINGKATEDYFVFKAYSYNSSNQQYIEKLWRSDGTIDGTIEFMEFNSSYSPFSNSQFNSIQNKVYFTQESTYPNQKLWVTDGTTAGTTVAIDGYREYTGFKLADDNTLFLKAKIDHSEDEILKIDYLSNNYSIFLENIINPERGFGIFNNEIFFGYDFNYFNNYHPSGSELWKSNLAGNNPIIVKDINVAAPSYPKNFYKIFDKTVFHAENGKETGLFISDGTVNGTNLLKDITIENSYSGETKTTFFPIGNQYFFRAKLQEEYAPDRLFKTNGTSEGTIMVSDEVELDNYNEELYEEFNGKLFFVGKDTFIGVNGHDLWVSDGTSGGTNRVYNLPSDSKINSMKSFGGYLYFTIQRGSEGREVWRTDGTNNGTESVFIAPYEYWQSEHPPFIIGEINEKLIFSNTNKYYAQYPDSYIEFYSINQENGAPQNFFTMDARPYFQYNISGRYQSINYQNKLFVPVLLFEGNSEFKLSFLKTDGTTEGTYVLEPLPLDELTIENLTNCGDYLYFTQGAGSYTYSLWRTDGENEGTVKLRSIEHDYERLSDFVCHKNNMYYSLVNFSSEQGDKGILEVTNGIPNQHREIQINRIDNEPILEIHELHSDGNLLYMSINERIHGNELYVSNPDFVLSTEEINEGLAKDNSNVFIYPNPTSSEINVVSNDQSKIKQIQLYDLNGKLLEIGIYNSIEVKLNIDKYNSGIYLLKVQTEKNTTTKKVILK